MVLKKYKKQEWIQLTLEFNQKTKTKPKAKHV